MDTIQTPATEAGQIPNFSIHPSLAPEQNTTLRCTFTSKDKKQSNIFVSSVPQCLFVDLLVHT